MGYFDSSQNSFSISDIIKKYRIIYGSFNSVFSIALNEEIHFNSIGFKHLIYKKGHRRPNKVIYSRMVLVPLIKPVIYSCEEVVEVRLGIERIKGEEVAVKYCSLEAKVGKSKNKIRVVVKKIGENGNYFFQSIMKLD